MGHVSRKLLAATFIIGFASTAFAQTSSRLDKQIKDQESKVAALQKELDAGHGKIERQLGQVVHLSASIRDTKSSGSRAVRIKKEVLGELKKLIEFYRTEKERLQKKAKNERKESVKSIWEEQSAIADYLVEKRVDEIIKIAGSLTSYPAYDGDDDNLSPNARRDAEKVGKRLREGLDKDRKELEAEKAALEKKADRTKDKAEAEKLRKQAEGIGRLIEKREYQAVGTVTGKTGAQKPVGKRTASDLDRRIRKSLRDIRSSYGELLRDKRKADEAKKQLAILLDRKAKLK